MIAIQLASPQGWRIGRSIDLARDGHLLVARSLHLGRGGTLAVVDNEGGRFGRIEGGAVALDPVRLAGGLSQAVAIDGEVALFERREGTLHDRAGRKHRLGPAGTLVIACGRGRVCANSGDTRLFVRAGGWTAALETGLSTVTHMAATSGGAVVLGGAGAIRVLDLAAASPAPIEDVLEVACLDDEVLGVMTGSGDLVLVAHDGTRRRSLGPLRAPGSAATGALEEQAAARRSRDGSERQRTAIQRSSARFPSPRCHRMVSARITSGIMSDGIDRIAPTRRPTGRVVQRPGWHDLTFLHWRVPVAALRPLVPDALEIDTFDGDALGSPLVPFTHGRPFVPWWLRRRCPGCRRLRTSSNVRTYVRHRGSRARACSSSASMPPTTGRRAVCRPRALVFACPISALR